MTAFEIVRNQYPGIPDAILNQFSALLPAEASAINPDFAMTDKIFYATYLSKLSKTFTFRFNYRVWWFDQRGAVMSFSKTMLTPQNQNEIMSVDTSCVFVASETCNRQNVAPPIIETGPHFNVSGMLKSIFDRRLYGTPTIKMTSRAVFPIGINNNPNAQAFGYYAAGTIAQFVAEYPTAIYSGIDSIKVLYENGVIIPEINYDDVYTFSTYISAYKKFATQIESEKNLLEQQARNTVSAYQQQLNDQAEREYADLQAKKIQMLIAIDNDAKGAQRDFQNMLLTAQGLKNQIGGSIG